MVKTSRRQTLLRTTLPAVEHVEPSEEAAFDFSSQPADEADQQTAEADRDQEAEQRIDAPIDFDGGVALAVPVFFPISDRLVVGLLRRGGVLVREGAPRLRSSLFQGRGDRGARRLLGRHVTAGELLGSALAYWAAGGHENVGLGCRVWMKAVTAADSNLGVAGWPRSSSFELTRRSASGM